MLKCVKPYQVRTLYDHSFLSYRADNLTQTDADDRLTQKITYLLISIDIMTTACSERSQSAVQAYVQQRRSAGRWDSVVLTQHPVMTCTVEVAHQRQDLQCHPLAVTAPATLTASHVCLINYITAALHF